MKLEALCISDNKIKQMKSKGITEIEELVSFYPKRYVECRSISSLCNIADTFGPVVALKGIIVNIANNYKYVRAEIEMDRGDKFYIFWFNQPYIIKKLSAGEKYVFCGKLQYSEDYKSYSMVNPMILNHKHNTEPIIPVYSKIRGMSDEYLSASIKKAIALLEKEARGADVFDEEMRARLNIDEYISFLKKAHMPQTKEDISAVYRRQSVEELLPFALKIEQKKFNAVSESSIVITKTERTEKFISRLPFVLTEGQKDAIDTILQKMKEGKRVDALLQGDVACGKTIVAIILAHVMAENGFQTALMCPTGVLAGQHFEEIKMRFSDSGFVVGYLHGGLKAKERKTLLTDVYTGKVNVLIGTHAVISEDVIFDKLGLTVVDEEHRFGVMQRGKLKLKADEGIHNLSMSATPIPRTLALSVYGDSVTVINIKSLPQGRKPVKTIFFSDEQKVYRSIYKELLSGRQCYIVCPLIDETANEKLSNVDSVEETKEKAKEFFKDNPDVKIEAISGNLKQPVIDEIITRFAKGEINILISTTIIEVGVNVPNATVMMVKNAERFGLAQLHQLRGRVGRGKYQSYCVLLSQDKTNQRLTTMVEVNDGFEIAQRDLELRGAGNIVGTEQSGFDKCIELMLSNEQLYKKIVHEADRLIIAKNQYDSFINN